MISIIVPIYNAERCLSRCIESILSQTYSEWELILIDDGSYDNSKLICNKYANLDSRISVIHQKNSGVSSARNSGLRQAKGEWITFCDSDDELENRAIELYVTNIHEDIDIVRGGFKRIKDDNVSIVTTSNIETEDKGEITSLCNESRYEAYLWNSCFRRSAIGPIRFDEKISWCEDHLFTFQVIGRARKVKFISDIVYRYYVPIKNSNTSGLNLSTKYIEPKMVIDEAVRERDIKRSFLSDDSIEVTKLIESEYKYKVNIALRYAIIGNRYYTALNIAAANGIRSLYELASIIFHTKITAIIRKLVTKE